MPYAFLPKTKVLNDFFRHYVTASLKQWSFFSKRIQNTVIPYLSDYIRIVCAIINRYKTRAIINTDNDIYGDKMLSLLNDENKLKDRLNNSDLMHHSKWKNYDAAYFSFPEITEQDLFDITNGGFPGLVLSFL